MSERPLITSTWSGEIFGSHVREGAHDVTPDLGVHGIGPFEEILHLLAFCEAGRRAEVLCDRKAQFSCKAVDFSFLHKGEGSDDGDFSSEHLLPGDHGAQFSHVEEVQKKGFDQVVPVVSEGDFGAIEAIGKLEEPFSPEHGA